MMQERIEYGNSKSDPTGDNFYFQRSNPTFNMDYYYINGTEGNAILTDIGRVPDTEDLNRNDFLDQETVILDMKYHLIQMQLEMSLWLMGDLILK